ncbi:hypothetical protein ACFQHO_39145 [Actinomadura yumaensis]|uniref:hypothetical protein n=1 Tax=Actinomadura yumaensis TaxID=111807 RepID=UPI0036106CC0
MAAFVTASQTTKYAAISRACGGRASRPYSIVTGSGDRSATVSSAARRPSPSSAAG